MAALHGRVADHLGEGEPADAVVGIEIDRGTWVQALPPYWPATSTTVGAGTP